MARAEDARGLAGAATECGHRGQARPVRGVARRRVPRLGRHRRGRAAHRRRARADEEVQRAVRRAHEDFADGGRGPRVIRARTGALAVTALLLAAAPARAHEMTMAEMEVRETAPGDFFWQWSAQNDKRPMGDDLKPRWPMGCATGPNMVRCGAEGLKGTLSIDGVGQRYSAAIVKVFWLDGGKRVYTLTKAQPTAQLYGSADD